MVKGLGADNVLEAKRFDRNVVFLGPYFESGVGCWVLGWAGGGWAGLAGLGLGLGLGLAVLKRKLVCSKMERLCPDQTKETNSNKQFLFISFLRV